MNKKFFIMIMMLITTVLAYSENEAKKSADGNNDRIEKGNHNKKKLVKLTEEQDRYYRKSEEYFKYGRFGSEYVGFISLPDWEEVKWLIDTGSTTYTLEISEDGIDIYSLDSFNINDKHGLNDEETAKNLVEQEFRKYLNEGHKRNNLLIKRIEASGYKGMQLKVKELSGKTLIQNVFVIRNKVYIANAEGLSNHIDHMEKVILDSWNPER